MIGQPFIVRLAEAEAVLASNDFGADPDEVPPGAVAGRLSYVWRRSGLVTAVHVYPRDGLRASANAVSVQITDQHGERLIRKGDETLGMALVGAFWGPGEWFPLGRLVNAGDVWTIEQAADVNETPMSWLMQMVSTR